MKIEAPFSQIQRFILEFFCEIFAVATLVSNLSRKEISRSFRKQKKYNQKTFFNEIGRKDVEKKRFTAGRKETERFSETRKRKERKERKEEEEKTEEKSR